MRRIFLAMTLGAAGLMVLAACESAPADWVKPGAGDEDFQREHQACATAARGFNPPVFDPRTMNLQQDTQGIAQQENSCMFQRGWRLEPRRGS